MGTREEILERASRIKMIALDNDGVFTNRYVYIGSNGESFKAFDIRDGFGILMARKVGIHFCIITGILDAIVQRRSQDLGISEVHLGFTDKCEKLMEVAGRYGIELSQIAYMGDDLFDLPILRRVGLGCSPSDAHPLVLKEVHWVSQFPGGRGCVRELIELVLRARGDWDRALRLFLPELEGTIP